MRRASRKRPRGWQNWQKESHDTCAKAIKGMRNEANMKTKCQETNDLWADEEGGTQRPTNGRPVQNKVCRSVVGLGRRSEMSQKMRWEDWVLTPAKRVG